MGTGKPYPLRGSKSPLAKLTEAQAHEVLRRAKAGESYRLLAAELGVHKSTVARLVSGRSWPGLDSVRGARASRSSTKLTEDQVRSIRLEHGAGMSYRQLASKYGVSTMPISQILKGLTWKHVL